MLTAEEQPRSVVDRDPERDPRSIRIFHDYLREKRSGTRALLTRAQIEPADFSVILPNIVMMDVHHDPLDFEVRVAGEAVIRNSTRNYTGIRWSTIPGREPDSHIWRFFESVVKDGETRHSAMPYVGPHKDFLSVELLACPLTTIDDKVRKIICAIDYVPR